MRITVPASQITSWLESGYQLAAGQFTFSVPDISSIWPGYGYGDEIGQAGFSLPGTAMAGAFVSAIALWDELIAPDFHQVRDDASSRGELRIAVTDMDSNQSAYAFYPSWVGGKPGDIWFNPKFGPWEWDEGGFDFYTMIHEIGHAIGLEHLFDAPDAPKELDSHRFSVMSYDQVEEHIVSFGYNNGDFFAFYNAPEPQTPMVLDIAAVQEIYGADPDTRAGDTVYRLKEWSPALQTIYDAGGNDTIDLSDFTLPSRVDLDSGAYSSIGMASAPQQIAHWSEIFPENARFISYVFEEHLQERDMAAFEYTDNLGIALSSVIENAIGGSANDHLSGNDADNLLIGNNGNDTLVGRSGSDRLEGGSGDDILRGDDDFTVAVGPAAAAPPVEPEILVVTDILGIFGLQLIGLARTGSLQIIDSTTPAKASAKTTTVAPAPDSAAAIVAEQGSGEDTLLGGDGNDLLDGGPGRDLLIGGAGADLFVFADGDFAGISASTSDRIEDFSQSEGDRIDLSAIDALSGAGDNAFRFIGKAGFTGNGGELRYADFADHLMITGDTNGDAFADFAIRLDDIATISASGFIL
ncbi:MAG: M10 family metallopeptidase C-terminal domain-containing protein [Sphingomonadaceae bacterium]|nr:M10 family metallopeptidase C-terminal domain-containing protein [Sphingomonadaceae bacterium]